MTVPKGQVSARLQLPRQPKNAGLNLSLTDQGKLMTKTEDFSEFFLAETSVVALDLPDGEPMLYQGEPVRVHVYGPATVRFTKANEAMQKEAAKRVMAAIGNKNKKEAEDKDADAKFLVAITERIENFPYPGGVEAVYREPKLKYIADQVRTFVGDTGNFFGPGEKA